MKYLDRIGTILSMQYKGDMSNFSMDTTLKEKYLGTHSQLKKINREIN